MLAVDEGHVVVHVLLLRPLRLGVDAVKLVVDFGAKPRLTDPCVHGLPEL